MRGAHAALSTDDGLQLLGGAAPQDRRKVFVTRDLPHGRARIEAHDAEGRRAAEHLLGRLDELARAAGEEGFVGQAMDAPDPGR